MLLPCKPTPLSRTVQLAGQPVKLSLHACSAGGQTWALAYADVGDLQRVGAALDELSRSAAANLSATAVQARPELVVAGATRHEASRRWALDGQLPDGQKVKEEAAVFTRGTFVYQVTVLGASLPAEGVATFFDSIRLLP
jgi:hypothetical protein